MLSNNKNCILDFATLLGKMVPMPSLSETHKRLRQKKKKKGEQYFLIIPTFTKESRLEK